MSVAVLEVGANRRVAVGRPNAPEPSVEKEKLESLFASPGALRMVGSRGFAALPRCEMLESTGTLMAGGRDLASAAAATRFTAGGAGKALYVVPISLFCGVATVAENETLCLALASFRLAALASRIRRSAANAAASKFVDVGEAMGGERVATGCKETPVVAATAADAEFDERTGVCAAADGGCSRAG